MTLYAQVDPCTLDLPSSWFFHPAYGGSCLSNSHIGCLLDFPCAPPSELRKGQLLTIFQPTLASFPFHCDPSSDKDIHCHFDFRNQFPPLGSVWFYSNIECHLENVYFINSSRIPCVHDVLIIFTHPTSLLPTDPPLLLPQLVPTSSLLPTESNLCCPCTWVWHHLEHSRPNRNHVLKENQLSPSAQQTLVVNSSSTMGGCS